MKGYIRYIATPIEDLELGLHWWNKGEDYDCFVSDKYIRLASEIGEKVYSTTQLDELRTVFILIEDIGE